MQIHYRYWALLAATFSLVACVAPGTSPENGTSAAPKNGASTGPAAEPAKNASQDSAPAVTSIDMPNFVVGDSCTYERTVNGRKQTDRRVLSEITDGRQRWTSSMDKSGTAAVEFDATTMDVYRDVALANNQKISFSSPYRWVDYPLSVGKTWETQAVVKGESFTADVKTKAVAGKWEKMKVPAGEFDAIKVTWKEQIFSNGSHGSGTLTYWMSPASKCILKATYSNTWGERGQTLLVAISQ